MKKLRPRLTFANMVSCLALFVALGGSAYAATQLPKNSVGSKQLKKNSVTAAKVKKHTLTGTQINLAKLGTVPQAQHAASADSIPQAEPIRMVGAPGQPGFENGASNFGAFLGHLNLPAAGFYKDAFGIVHLEGVVKVGSKPALFTLPPGYRPAPGTLQFFEPASKADVLILGSDAEGVGAGAVTTGAETNVVLNGITFRAEG